MKRIVPFHGQISKFIAESLSISYGPSGAGIGGGGGGNCSRACRLFSLCYAVRQERIYSGLSRMLQQHAKWGAVKLTRLAIAAFPTGKPLQWFRVSVDGSLPSRGSMSVASWKRFASLFTTLIRLALTAGARIHIPVETKGKARDYRTALKTLPDVVVRRSSQAKTAEAMIDEASVDDPSSFVCGPLHNGRVSADQKRANTEIAHAVAQQIRQSGKGLTAVVCPAVRDAEDNPSKCGRCTACSSASVTVVLYPFHG